MNDDIRLVSLTEFAKRTGLSVHTARRWASMGRIPVVKLGRRRMVDVLDIERLIKDAKQPARRDVAI